MAETLISPGVLARENDQSFIGAPPITFGAAIIGPAIQGPVGIPTAVSSFSQYEAIFGGSVESGSQYYSYLNSAAASNYFQQGGESLLVTRVVSGSAGWSEASSSIENTDTTSAGTLRTDINMSSSVSANTLSGQSAGTHALGSVTGGAGSSAAGTYTVTADGVVTSVNFTAGAGYAVTNTLTVQGSQGGGAGTFVITLKSSDLESKDAFVLKTISEGAITNNYQAGVDSANGTLDAGTRNNVRWEITGANTGSGQFSLSIRRGNDTATQKAVLEQYNNLSMDPTAANYVAKVIGNTYYTVEQDGVDYYVKSNGDYPNSSAYVFVGAVNSPTPQYFDNNGAAKSAYFSSIPAIGSGSFQGGNGTNINSDNSPVKFNQNITDTNIQGLIAAEYTQSLNLLSNTDAYSFNVITAPGLINSLSAHSSVVSQMVALAQSRTDCIAVVDLVPYNSTVNTVVTQASAFDSSYAATYWPWLQSIDANAQYVWSPASVFIPGVYAFTDSSSDPWFAPAGLIRGALGNVVKAERKLTSGNRDNLYEANVNPIATFPGSGVVVFGQKTLQKKASALDRVNVRRLLIALKSYIVQVSDNLVFEQNSISTRNSFLSQVNPYLESVQQRQGLYAFKVVMDATNNTPDVIDRNELVGQIYLQPTKTAEFILLDFNVLPTGATFPS
jgi:hypothetical protein